MVQRLLLKVGYYSIFETKSNEDIKYVVDNGKTLFIKRFNKYVSNPYRDVKPFNTLLLAKEYVMKKLEKKTKEKKKENRKVTEITLPNIDERGIIG